MVGPKRLPMATKDQILYSTKKISIQIRHLQGTERLHVAFVTFLITRDFLFFKSRHCQQNFYFCLLSSFSLCCLLLPTNDAQYTVAEAKKTIVFLWLSHFHCSVSVSVTTNQSDWSISSVGDRGLFIIGAPLGGSLPNTGLCPLWSA